MQDLLADSNPMVVANAVAALADIRETSTRNVFSLNTQSLQKLLRALNECTEWGQVGATGRILSCMPECATTCMQRLRLGLFNWAPCFLAPMSLQLCPPRCGVIYQTGDRSTGSSEHSEAITCRAADKTCPVCGTCRCPSGLLC